MFMFWFICSVLGAEISSFIPDQFGKFSFLARFGAKKIRLVGGPAEGGNENSSKAALDPGSFPAGSAG
jgi:hypothetical protein